uniref:Uncharacterized protein n=1 Tax=Lepeophtheirus salmonis TaxID=72036 RepID=A0A0K2SXP9_LEPSM
MAVLKQVPLHEQQPIDPLHPCPGEDKTFFLVLQKFISIDVPCSQHAHRRKEDNTPHKGFKDPSTLLVPGRNNIHPC